MHLDLLPLPRNHLARYRNADLSGGDKCALEKPPPDLLGKGCYLTHLGTQAACFCKETIHTGFTKQEKPVGGLAGLGLFCLSFLPAEWLPFRCRYCMEAL